jgi:hypothetical protein
MRVSGVRGLLAYCGDYRCSHSVTMSGAPWPDDFRLSELDREAMNAIDQLIVWLLSLLKEMVLIPR